MSSGMRQLSPQGRNENMCRCWACRHQHCVMWWVPALLFRHLSTLGTHSRQPCAAQDSRLSCCLQHSQQTIASTASHVQTVPSSQLDTTARVGLGLHCKGFRLHCRVHCKAETSRGCHISQTALTQEPAGLSAALHGIMLCLC